MCSCVSAGLQCGVDPVQLPAVPVNTGQVQLGNKQPFHGVRTRDCVRQCGWSYKGTCPEWRGFPWGWPATWSGAKKTLNESQFWFRYGEGLQERGPVAFTEAFKYTLQKNENLDGPTITKRTRVKDIIPFICQ